MKGYHSHRVYEGSVWSGRFDMVCDAAEYLTLDRTGNFMALAANHRDRIELWDVRSCSIPMNSVSFPPALRTGTNEPHKMWWSFDSSHLCALVDTWPSGDRKLPGGYPSRRNVTQSLLVWNVTDGTYVGDWIFKARVATASFIPGCQNSLIYITYQARQGHAVFNVKTGTMWEIDAASLRESILNGREAVWSKERFLESESKLKSGSCPFDGDASVSGVTSDNKPGSLLSSSAAVAVSASSGDKGGEMIVTLNDDKGNAACIVRVEMNFAWDAARNEFVPDSAQVIASTSLMPHGSSGPVLWIDPSRALSQGRLLIGWEHSTAAIYEYSDSLDMKWCVCSSRLHGVKPPKILSLGYVARRLEKRHQHLDMSKNGTDLNQNQQALDALVIVTESDITPSALSHEWSGKMIFCHEDDHIDMDTRLKWATFDSNKLSLSEAAVSPHPARMAIWGVGTFSQKKIRSGTTAKLHRRRSLQCYAQSLRSDFPGPMYPIGFSLREECNEYIEAEDELDGVVRNRKDGKPTADDELPVLCLPVQSSAASASLPNSSSSGLPPSSFTMPTGAAHQMKTVFDKGRYNSMPLLDPACSLDIGDSFGDLKSKRSAEKLSLCDLQARRESDQGQDASVVTLGEKTGSGLWRPYPREAAVMAYSQKVLGEDEVGDGVGAGNVPVGLIGSVFGPDIGVDNGDGEEDEEDDNNNDESEASRKRSVPPLNFAAFLRPPANVITGEYRAKVLAPQVAQAMQMADALNNTELRAEKNALLRKEAVDELRKDMIRRHKSLQNKLDKDRARQIADLRSRLTTMHTRNMEDIKRAHSFKLKEQERLQAVARQQEMAAQALGSLHDSAEGTDMNAAKGVLEAGVASKRDAGAMEGSGKGQPASKSMKL